MIKPKAMNRVTVFGPKSYMKPVIEKLYDMNVVHIEDHTKKSDDDVFDIGEPFESNESYAEHLVKIRSLISNLKLPKNEIKANSGSIDTIKGKTDKIYNDFSSLFRKKEYYTQVKKLYDKKLVEKSLSPMKIDFENKEIDFDSSLYYIGYINGSSEEFKAEVEKSNKKYLLNYINSEGLALVSLFVDKNKKEKAEKALEEYDFSAIDSPIIKQHFPAMKSKPGQKFVKLNYQAEMSEKKLEKINMQIDSLKKENADFLIASEKRLTTETEKAEAPLKFGTTKNTFLIKGWVPVEKAEKLESQLNTITKNKVMIKLEKPKRGESVPTAYDHPKIVEPFESFMDLYTLPSYKEIDPTFFMFLTFPIFFGFMLGDVGYGLITLSLFLLLRKKMPSAKNMLNAFIIASISSILFGVVFGEYMGYEELPHGLGVSLVHSLPEGVVKTFRMEPEKLHGEVIYPTPHLFSRSKQMSDLLSLSILMGITHILIGFIIGFINVYNAHGFKHALFEKGGWILIMPTIIWLLMVPLGVIKGFVFNMLSVLIPPLPILFGMFGLGAIFVILGEGITGAIEVLFLSLMSNILSYARLMAVGLASLSLAVVVNDLAGGMFRSGIVGIIAGIIILVLGHGINIALGILSPFLHALRLHYVEFFNKFFKGGGKRFRSFGHLE